MSEKAQQAIAEYLAAVDQDPVEWWFKPATGILAALKAAGYAVVELPEPDVDQYGDTIVPVPLVNNRDGWLRIEESREMHNGTMTPIRIASLGVSTPIELVDARAYAAALLAAADAAERAE